ncbi:MAG TPA: hypothetical protein VFU69_07600 [Ktedonobacterales bacterium]|nr:hypothetical protein [Ktedonobacterales bacterium]
MSRSLRRLGAVVVLAALMMMAALAGCTSSPNGVAQKATATTSPRATATSQPGGTPSATATPPSACGGKLSDILLPERAVQIGSTQTAGATTSCAYRVSEDLQSLATFFKTQMGKSGWRFLHDTPEGPMGFAQVYFKKQRFATITLTQHESDTHTTDVTISVESSQ